MLEYVGYVIVILIVIVVILVMRTLYSKYKESEDKGAYIFFLAFLNFLLGIVCLLIQILSVDVDIVFTRIFAILALVFSATGIILMNVFTFETTFPNKKIILTIFVTIFGALYVGASTVANINAMFGGNLSYIINGEIAYHPVISLINLIGILVVGVSAPIVFYYFANMIKDKDKPKSKRAFLMGFALTLFPAGYTLEVMAIASPITDLLVIIGRTLMLISATILLICFSMPEWFKNAIGWVDQ